MRRQAPHNPRPSRPGSEPKPMLGWGGLNRELADTEATLARGGGVIPAQRQESAIVSAVRENEARVKAATQKQQERDKKTLQQQSNYAARYHSRDEALERELEAQQHAFAGGAVSYALWQLDRQYGPSQPQIGTHPAVQSPLPREARGQQSTPVQQPTHAPVKQPVQQKYITRQQPAPTNTVTRHLCEHDGCRNLARYRNYGLWQCERHNAWGPMGSR